MHALMKTVLIGMTLCLCMTLQAEPWWIRGKVDISGLDNQFNEPLQVLLLGEVDDEMRALLEEQTKVFNALYAVQPDIKQLTTDPENATAIQAKLDSFVRAVPPSQAGQFQIEGQYMSIMTNSNLIQDMVLSLRELKPGNFRAGMTELRTQVIHNINQYLKVINAGYTGSSSGVNFMGVRSQGREADMSGARGVAQATIDCQWLILMDQRLGEFSQQLNSIELSDADTPQANWDRFQILKGNELELEVALRTIRQTTIEKGGFETFGEGTIVFAMPCYGYTVYFMEGLESSPVTIQRQ